MQGFRYKYGDRPLEGYTIQRAAGRGGFGEVYYAVSDSGREVALKVVQGYEQIELRGVGQCMNIKSPHLVTIFDVKHNDEGVPFVIMEFVSGPSLRQVLDESPSGLGTQKAAFFLREIGKGLSYLHECGIVHRDLKPGNIFYENGYVKIGDYGLSKAMATSQHSGQTMTVGTVHYMAPEISMGKYDRSIDLYAMGAMLYEMLTGQVPYLGGSPGEILMKHMTAEPDVSNIEEPFATVIKKAMHRDPAQRYANVQEMVEAVFGAAHVQQSVSCFSPDSLSMVAQRVAERVAVGGGSATPPPLPRNRGGGADLGEKIGAAADRFGRRMGEIGERMGELSDRFGQRMSRLGDRFAGEQGPVAEAPLAANAGPQRDPLSATHRRVLAICVMAVIAGVMALLQPAEMGRDGGLGAMTAFVAIAGAAIGIRLAQRHIMPQLAAESVGIQRLALAGLGIGMTMAFCFPIVMANPSVKGWGGTIAAVLVPMLLMDWMSAIKPDRKERVVFGHAVGVGALGFVVAMIFNGCEELAAGILAGTSLAVQVMAPWDPSAARRRKEAIQARKAALAAGAEMGMPVGADGGMAQTLMPAAQPVVAPTPSGSALPPPLPMTGILSRPVAPAVRYLWLAGIPLCISIGIMLLVFAGTERMSNGDFALAVAFGVGLLLLAILCLVKCCQSAFKGWWSYLIKPLLLYACVQTILISALMLGNARPSSDETLLGIFFIIFPLVLMPIVLFTRFGPAHAVAAPGSPGLAAMGAAAASSPAPSARHLAPLPAPPDATTMLMPVDPRPIPIRAATGLLGLVGGLLLLASMVVGLAVAVDIPGMLAAGLPDPTIAANVTRDARQAGIDDWQGLMHVALKILTGLGMIMAGMLLTIARRWAGPGHMFRALLGIGGCGIALITLHAALAGHWVELGGRPMPGAMVAFLNKADPAPVIAAAVFLVVSVVILCWPPPRYTRTQTAV